MGGGGGVADMMRNDADSVPGQGRQGASMAWTLFDQMVKRFDQMVKRSDLLKTVNRWPLTTMRPPGSGGAQFTTQTVRSSNLSPVND